MITAEEHVTPHLTTSPVVQPSSLANRFIPLRESLLNRLAQTSPRLPRAQSKNA